MDVQLGELGYESMRSGENSRERGAEGRHAVREVCSREGPSQPCIGWKVVQPVGRTSGLKLKQRCGEGSMSQKEQTLSNTMWKGLPFCRIVTQVQMLCIIKTCSQVHVAIVFMWRHVLRVMVEHHIQLGAHSNDCSCDVPTKVVVGFAYLHESFPPSPHANYC